MLMSMMTERGFIFCTVARETNTGARSPGTNTAPTSTLANSQQRWILRSVDSMVMTFMPHWLIRCKALISRSKTVTCAPIPVNARAA